MSGPGGNNRDTHRERDGRQKLQAQREREDHDVLDGSVPMDELARIAAEMRAHSDDAEAQR